MTIKDTLEPLKVKTEDGYTFYRQNDGTYTDGDMTFNSYMELLDSMMN
jgi:hypothetical protein